MVGRGELRKEEAAECIRVDGVVAIGVGTGSSRLRGGRLEVAGKMVVDATG